ncbi:hypothetical protein IFT54_05645 [Sphingomonas sp. CFBP 13714]|uniref:hypothetical protein n=1 Tax=Sphingomonas sp. CFBP 13714 TaxID=2775308 RepID=UPI001786858A|nr:hypothetical protein [Sphingomonas sp. CFBP 13714]MBD8699298.1 hypothetical protein [Sphingomonas sp. CFBP 13714]
MTQRLILTIDQARSIQRNETDWSFMLIPQMETPDSLADPTRMAIALTMKQRGCQDDQIAEQLGWKPKGGALRQLNRIFKQMP